MAARFTADTPLARVLAVVSEKTIASFADPRAGAYQNLIDGKPNMIVGSHPDRASAREISERNFFHLASEQLARERPIVDNAVEAHVDAVMEVASTGRNEVRPHRRLFTSFQTSIAFT